MKKKRRYIRKPIKNIAELHRAQDQIRAAYQKTEETILISILGLPVYSAINKLVTKNKKKGKRKYSAITDTKKEKSKSFTNRLFTFAQKPVIAYFIGSWWRWQLFNIAFFFGKKLACKLQKKRK